MLLSNDAISDDVNPHTCKMMMHQLLVLLTKEDVRKELRPYQVEDFAKISSHLYKFFDALDCDDVDKILYVEHILDYGDDEKDPEFPQKYVVTPDSIYRRYIEGWHPHLKKTRSL